MRRIWIVGKEGLLAQALARACTKRGLDFFATGQQEADVTRIHTLQPFAEEATHIINCAAYTNVDLAEKEREKAFAVNAQGPANLAKVSRGKLLHVSTDYVFDGNQTHPYEETDLCNPLSVYGKSKREGEIHCLDGAKDACIVRTSWLYGAGGKSFLSSLLYLMQTQEEVKVAGGQIGSPTFVDDLAETLLALLDRRGIFHVTNGGSATRYEIAHVMREAARAAGIPLRCKTLTAVPFVPVAARPNYSALAIRKVEEALGRPCREWKAAIREHVNHAL